MALRVDLCNDGNPAHPADHWDAEQIKVLCYLATVAIDLARALSFAKTAMAPGRATHSRFVRHPRTTLQQNLPALLDAECRAERGLDLRGVANLLRHFSQRVGR